VRGRESPHLVVLGLHAARSAFATARRDAERWRAGDEVGGEKAAAGDAEREGNKVGEAEYSRWTRTQGEAESDSARSGWWGRALQAGPTRTLPLVGLTVLVVKIGTIS
jgi:hypothetical protein